MVTIATLGPEHSYGSQAARQYLAGADLSLFPEASEVITAFEAGLADFAIIPTYNTREAESKEVRILEHFQTGYWIDNIILPIHLSFGLYLIHI